MINESDTSGDLKLDSLLNEVVHDPRLSVVEGLDPFARLLKGVHAARVLDYIETRLPTMPAEEQGGLAFVLAQHYLKHADLPSIVDLMAAEQPLIRSGTLNGLCGEPPPGEDWRAALIALMVRGCRDPNARVRAWAARALLNQAGHGTDVRAAIEPLRTLVSDSDPNVAMAAECAIGNFAKSKLDVSGCLDALRANLTRDPPWVRESAAWALGQMSKRHNIAAAVTDLIALVSRETDYRASEKEALRALLHHAKKGREHAHAVSSAASAAALSPSRKSVATFLLRVNEAMSSP